LYAIVIIQTIRTIRMNLEDLEAMARLFKDYQYEDFTGLSAKSRAIESGTDPYQSKQIFSDKFFGLIAKFMIYVNRRHSEFVTVQFVKSDIKKINSWKYQFLWRPIIGW